MKIDDPLAPDTQPNLKRRRKWKRWLFILLIPLGAVWLNGPGIRWLAPEIASYFLEKSGIHSDFKLQGTLIGGISITDLQLKSDHELASLTVDKIAVAYQIQKVIKGELDAISIDGLHADLRLGLQQKKTPSPALDLKKLTETIRSIRARVIPVSIELKNISVAVTRDGEPVFSLAKSDLIHQSGNSEIQLDLRAITDATGKSWPEQKSMITWNRDEILVPRLDLFQGIGLRDLKLTIPEGGEPSLNSMLVVNDAHFSISTSPGFAAVNIQLKKGVLNIADMLKPFGYGVPANATLSALSVDVHDIMPHPKAAVGELSLVLKDTSWRDWSANETRLDVLLSKANVTLLADIKALDTEISLSAKGPIVRSNTHFMLQNLDGDFKIESVPKLLVQLSKHTSAINPAARVPASSLTAAFKIGMAQNHFQSADVNLKISPEDSKLASAIGLKAGWEINAPIHAEVTLDGLKAAASYQELKGIYQGSADFHEFTTARVARWLDAVKVKTDGLNDLTGKWIGHGNVKAGKSQGDLTISEVSWSRKNVPSLTAIGSVSYDWPNRVDVKNLRIQSANQTIAFDAGLSNHVLEVRNFTWKEGDQEIANGTASLPVPEDFSQWKDLLIHDGRPLDVSIQTQKLSLGLMKQWLPAMGQLDPHSKAQANLQITGTYADPLIDAHIEALDLRTPAKPEVPAADLKITIKGSAGRLQLDATATAVDFPPAVIKADFPLRPADWAANPKLIVDEPINARVDLPRLDLSRFTTLFPGAEKLKGTVTGNVDVAGTIAHPAIKGQVDLTNGGLHFKNDQIPQIENLKAAVDLTLDKVTLKSFTTRIAGGTLNGSGSMTMKSGKPSILDFRLRGDHLPIQRNNYLILRSNIDLRLQGPFESATLSGSLSAVDSVFYRDIDLLPIGTPFHAPTVAALPKIDPPKSKGLPIPAPFGNWPLNVVVRTQAPFLIRGNLATGEVKGSIRVRGTLANPLPDGAVTIRDFRATLPFSTLSVPSGTLTFTPSGGFDPILEIRGTSEPRPYQVTFYAYGRASDPQLVLTSNPPLPENEIMTLLATGTTTSGLENPQEASSRAMQLLAEEIRRGRFRFSKKLRPLLGLLDHVNFSLAESDPYSSDKFSTATLSITNRWFISAGMGEEGDSRFMAIWRLSFR